VQYDEAADTYRTLAQTLSAEGLDWIVEQVSREIAFGKLASRQPDKEERKLSRDLFSATEEFTPQERLLMLLEGIEQAVVETAGMQRVVLSIVGATKAQVLFGPPSPEGIEYRFGEREARAIGENAERLKTLLAEIRGEILRGT